MATDPELWRTDPDLHYGEAVPGPDGQLHVIPSAVLRLGIDILDHSYDPFDPGPPSHRAVAEAYIAMLYADKAATRQGRTPSAGAVDDRP